MKRLIFVFCLFSFFSLASAQDSLHAKADTRIRDMKSLPTSSDPVYVIDGVVVEDSLAYKKLNPADIFEITLLHDASATAIYGYRAANGATLITTKKEAQKIYQAKLSAFSSKYKSYMEKHNDDSNLLYVLNNTMLQIDKKRLRELYDLQPADIKKVTFKTDSRFKNDATVVIITNDADSN